VPVEESASGSFAYHDFPRGDHFELLIPEEDVFELFLGENVGADQVKAVLDHGLSQLVVATLVTLNDVHHKFHHVLLDCCVLRLHSIDFLHSFFDLSHNELTSVSIDQDHPFVDQELFGLELDLDGFQHLNCLDNDLEGRFGHSSVIFLEQEKIHLERSLDLSSKLDTCSDLIGSDVQEILVQKHLV
jgi:hypothetical protein